MVVGCSNIHGHKVVSLDTGDSLFLDTLGGAFLFLADALVL